MSGEIVQVERPTTTRIVVPLLMVSLCAGAPLYAAFYEFTLQGTVSSSGLPDVSVGDPCTIWYVADPRDLAPDPAFGTYLATPAILTFPNATLSANPHVGSSITVNLVFGAIQRVAYQNDGPFYGVGITLQLPQGTLDSDALPLTLPLSNAISATFGVSSAFNPVIVGTLTSYSSAEVPEPGAAVGLALLPLLLSRMK